MSYKRKIIRIIGYLFLAAIILLFIYTLAYHQQLRTQFNDQIQAYGPIGLVVAGFLIDVFGGPIGPEVPVTSGLLAGLNVQTVIFMTFIGSVIGTLLVYSIGYHLIGYGAQQIISHQKYDHWRKVFTRHRRITMVLGALTPVPYEVVCLIAGAFKVRLWEYIVFTIGARFVRIAGAAYIVLLFQGVI